MVLYQFKMNLVTINLNLLLLHGAISVHQSKSYFKIDALSFFPCLSQQVYIKQPKD